MSPGELLAAACIGIGLVFVAVAAIGFVRLPDVFCRLHVTGIMDTLGVPMILLGAMVHLGVSLQSAKLLLAMIFLVFTSPLLGHLLARAALEAGLRPETVGEGQGAPPGAGEAG